ncbi:hypothetical protein [Microbulbifer pacificus]|uniref:hypothetical protein n=1 Tax=Microbulbifer pacificus TaxID=407164 RepID=UPI000CF3B4AB|nr:hypothetical protein [Microbulbifer pacificus]
MKLKVLEQEVQMLKMDKKLQSKKLQIEGRVTGIRFQKRRKQGCLRRSVQGCIPSGFENEYPALCRHCGELRSNWGVRLAT